jgi:hypothetical protein
VSVSVSVDRSALSLTALVFNADGPTYRITEQGLGRPGITWRRTAAPDSVNVHGTEYVAASKEQSSLPLEVGVYAGTTADLDAACVALEDALSQFAYDVTVTEDGVVKVWSAGPADMASGLVDSGEVASHIRTYTITIPVYPIPGSA